MNVRRLAMNGNGAALARLDLDCTIGYISEIAKQSVGSTGHCWPNLAGARVHGRGPGIASTCEHTGNRAPSLRVGNSISVPSH